MAAAVQVAWACDSAEGAAPRAHVHRTSVRVDGAPAARRAIAVHASGKVVRPDRRAAAAYEQYVQGSAGYPPLLGEVSDENGRWLVYEDAPPASDSPPGAPMQEAAEQARALLQALTLLEMLAVRVIDVPREQLVRGPRGTALLLSPMQLETTKPMAGTFEAQVAQIGDRLWAELLLPSSSGGSVLARLLLGHAAVLLADDDDARVKPVVASVRVAHALECMDEALRALAAPAPPENLMRELQRVHQVFPTELNRMLVLLAAMEEQAPECSETLFARSEYLRASSAILETAAADHRMSPAQQDTCAQRADTAGTEARACIDKAADLGYPAARVLRACARLNAAAATIDELAQQGVAEALYARATLMQRFDGDALSQYRMAAERGCQQAYVPAAGLLLAEGGRASRDEAVRLLTTAVRASCPVAMELLADLQVLGVAPDLQYAHDLYARSLALGNSNAAARLALVLVRQGRAEEAAALLTDHARLGVAGAAHVLASCHVHGVGVAPSRAQAYVTEAQAVSNADAEWTEGPAYSPLEPSAT